MADIGWWSFLNGFRLGLTNSFSLTTVKIKKKKTNLYIYQFRFLSSLYLPLGNKNKENIVGASLIMPTHLVICMFYIDLGNDQWCLGFQFHSVTNYEKVNALVYSKLFFL